MFLCRNVGEKKMTVVANKGVSRCQDRGAEQRCIASWTGEINGGISFIKFLGQVRQRARQLETTPRESKVVKRWREEMDDK